IDTELRALIRRMSIENPLWGAPRIHGELLKLGFEVAQSTVAKYMVKQHGPPSQGWRTFLCNHAGYRRHGLVRCPNIWLQPALYPHHRQTGQENPHLGQLAYQSNRRMDRAPTIRGFPLERGPALRYSRSGSHLRHRRHTPFACHGHKGQAHRTGLALAEWLR